MWSTDLKKKALSTTSIKLRNFYSLLIWNMLVSYKQIMLWSKAKVWFEIVSIKNWSIVRNKTKYLYALKLCRILSFFFFLNLRTSFLRLILLFCLRNIDGMKSVGNVRVVQIIWNSLNSRPPVLFLGDFYSFSNSQFPTSSNCRTEAQFGSLKNCPLKMMTL